MFVFEVGLPKQLTEVFGPLFRVSLAFAFVLVLDNFFIPLAFFSASPFGWVNYGKGKKNGN